MKKVYVIISLVIVVIAGSYIGLRYGVLHTKDQKPDQTKARSILDLRPAIIAKLQQLVKDGSSGLYQLNIDKLEPNIAASTVELFNVSLVPDTAGMQRLDKLQQLPTDIFKITFSALKIEGINVNDIVPGDKISLSKVTIDKPVIEVYRQKRNYSNTDTLTLYRKILRSFKSIAVDEVRITGGTFISHHNKERRQVNNVVVNLQDVLIDSSSQYDKGRKLFAKQLNITVHNYESVSKDKLYRIKLGKINISAVEDKVTASAVELHPAVSKQQFLKKLSARKEIFNISIPRVTLSGVDWWLLFNEAALSAHDAVMENGRCSVYLDRSLPFRNVKQDNYPHQLLMRVPVPVSIGKLYMRNAKLIYTEFNPAMSKAGTIEIDGMHGQMTNITNMPEKIRSNGSMTISSQGRFMRSIPLSVRFNFNLARYATGDFSMKLQIGRVDSSVLNRITIPLSEFMLKKGVIQKGTAEVSGNNFRTHGKGELLYNDLYLVAVEKEAGKPNNVDKKGVLSFLANTVLIKNNNPSKGNEPRRVDFEITRESKLTYFSFVWKTIFIGILKTIGLPESFAERSY